MAMSDIATNPILIVPCAKSKKAVPIADMRHIRRGAAAQIALEWIDALDARAISYPVRELYAGPVWNALSRYSGELRVASAGLGLVSPTALVPPYDATFSGGPNSVGKLVTDGSEAWWREINRLRHGTAHPIASLLEDPENWILVALPRAYRSALASDLNVALDTLPGRLLVLGTEMMPFPPHARTYYRTTTLAAPIIHAIRILEQQRTPVAAHAFHHHWLERLNAPAVPRVPISAGELDVWCSSRRHGSQRESLSLLRGEGKACSVERFARAFTKATATATSKSV